MIDIAELRRLEAEATPGPWQSGDDTIYDPSSILHGRRLVASTGGYSDGGLNTRPENLANAALIVAMRNALPELLKALEWQPIETAPKDAIFLAWAKNWHWSHIATCYRHSDYNGHKDVVCRDGQAGPPFRIGGPDAPTHWMPLPLPPHGGGDVG